MECYASIYCEKKLASPSNANPIGARTMSEGKTSGNRDLSDTDLAITDEASARRVRNHFTGHHLTAAWLFAKSATSLGSAIAEEMLMPPKPRLDFPALAPLARPFTCKQTAVVQLIAKHFTYEAIGRALNMSPATVKAHAEDAAAKIPGTLPTKAKICVWARGSTPEVLLV